MALLASGQAVKVDTVAPDMAKSSAAHKDVGWQYPPPPPHVSGDGASFVKAVEQSSQGSVGRSCAPRGGGGSSPFNFRTTCPF